MRDPRLDDVSGSAGGEVARSGEVALAAGMGGGVTDESELLLGAWLKPREDVSDTGEWRLVVPLDEEDRVARFGRRDEVEGSGTVLRCGFE